MTTHDKFLNISKKQLRNINFFWLGFFIYTTSYAFAQSGHLNYKVFQGFQSIGLLSIFASAIHLIRIKLPNAYLQNVFIVYCLWLLLIILRGASHDYGSIKKMLFDASYGMMPYFAPLILLFPQNIAFYKKAFRIIILFGIFYIIYDLAFIKDLLNTDHTSIKSTEIAEYSALLSIPSCFILLTFPYHSSKRIIFSIIVILLTLLFAIIRARRGLIFICASQILFSYFLYLGKSKNRMLNIVAFIIILLTGVYFTKDIHLENRENIFSFLMERGTKDTRTGVEEYFYNDLKPKDWALGKGINGQYFCPDIDENAITGYRSIIETGYLQIILNGGIVSLALILLIAIPAIFKGLFYSRNTLSKAAGLWILSWVMYLYPTTMQGFTLYYALFWISIGICYSKTVRNIPESKMKLLFLSKEQVFLSAPDIRYGFKQ